MRSGGSAKGSILASEVGLTTLEVVRGALGATAEEMKSIVMRASFSPLLTLSGDLSCAVLDGKGQVVAQGNDIPVHLGAMPFTARGILSKIPAEDIAPGDVLITNDPYLGGTHLPDVTVMSPIFDEEGLVGFVASRVHWPDVGGASAGSSKATDEAIKEGLRIPPAKLVEEGELDEKFVELLLANMRVPSERRGDLEAQLAGNRRGVWRIEELVSRYGGGTVREVFEESQRYSQILVEQALQEIPDGEYRFEERLDGDGFEEEDAPPELTIRVTIAKTGGEVHFDFDGSSPCSRGPVNAPFAVTASSVYYVVLAVLGGDIPPNSGAYRPVRITAPEGTLVNATYPAPVVAGNTETSNRIVDVLLGALARAAPERVTAGSYGSAAVYTLGGWDPARRRSFVHYETIGGGMGAFRGGEGLSGMRVHMGNTMNLPIEMVESRLPVRIRRYELIPDSGGHGRWRGGRGVRKVVQALCDGIDFSVLGERARTPAPGICGGATGKPANFFIRTGEGKEISLRSKAGAPRLMQGWELWLETAGGGGYGDDAGDAQGGYKARSIPGVEGREEGVGERGGVTMSAEMSSLDHRLRIGVLVPSSNTVMENDLHQALPKTRYTVHTARMYLEETTAAAERRMVEEFAPAAAEQLKTLYPHLLVFGCTSAGSLGGLSYDREICHRLGELAGCPGIGVISSVAEALDRRGLRRLAVLTPYVGELTDSVGQSLEGQGFEVVTARGMGIDVNFDLARPSPSDIVEFAKESLNGIRAEEGVFVSCTNFRAFEALPLLEEAFSLPVVTSNSAVLEAIEQFALQRSPIS